MPVVSASPAGACRRGRVALSSVWRVARRRGGSRRSRMALVVGGSASSRGGDSPRRESSSSVTSSVSGKQLLARGGSRGCRSGLTKGCGASSASARNGNGVVRRRVTPSAQVTSAVTVTLVTKPVGSALWQVSDSESAQLISRVTKGNGATADGQVLAMTDRPWRTSDRNQRPASIKKLVPQQSLSPVPAKHWQVAPVSGPK